MLVLRWRLWFLALVTFLAILSVLGIVGIVWSQASGKVLFSTATSKDTTSITQALENIFRIRVEALVSGDTSGLENYYDNTGTTGRWALNHEIGRSKYIQEWLSKRNLELVAYSLQLKIVDVGLKSDSQAWASVSQHIVLHYRKPGLPQTQASQMGLRTIHWVEMVWKDNK